MRKLFLISVIILCFCPKILAQVDITVDCQDSWGPGRYNKVSVKVDFGKSDGFARFTQEFPIGFEIIADNIPDGDFMWTGDKLNMVWIRLPEKKASAFSYLIKPDKSMNGSIEMTGRIVLISGDDIRQTILMKEKPISIGGLNGFLPEEIKTKPATTDVKIITKMPAVTRSTQNNGIVFRVQVSVSSSKISGEGLKKKFGIASKETVTVIKEGNVFKYQVGSFPDYDSANNLLKQLIAKGIKDAFIVVYKGEKQITLEKAKEQGK
jgi:hypothetical protein